MLRRLVGPVLTLFGVVLLIVALRVVLVVFAAERLGADVGSALPIPLPGTVPEIPLGPVKIGGPRPGEDGAPCDASIGKRKCKANFRCVVTDRTLKRVAEGQLGIVGTCRPNAGSTP